MVFHDWSLMFLADLSRGLSFYDIQQITATYQCTGKKTKINQGIKLIQGYRLDRKYRHNKKYEIT